jgi:conjugative transposon TraN protein
MFIKAKMRKGVFAVCFFTISMAGYIHVASAQTKSLLPLVPVRSYPLQVGYRASTVLVFPATIKSADRGTKDLLATKDEAAPNLLKVKSAIEDLAATNLHVTTSDGSVYDFQIEYATYPFPATFYVPAASMIEKALIEGQPLADDELKDYEDRILSARPFLHVRHGRDKMVLRVNGIYEAKGLLFLQLALVNRSRLAFDLDFMKCYIKDAKKAKRSSIQEREITPYYTGELVTVPGRDQQSWVMAIEKLTVPDNRQLYLEVYEKNGGRNISLRIKNKQLFKARQL